MTLFTRLVLIITVSDVLKAAVSEELWASAMKPLSADDASKMVDSVIASSKADVIASGNADGKVKVNDVNGTFNYKVWPLSVSGKLGVAGGEFSNLLTARQTAPPTVEVYDPSSMMIRAHIGLEELHIAFGHVEARLTFFAVTGGADVYVIKNSAYVEVEVERTPTCNVRIVDFGIDDFSDLFMQIHGFNMLNFINDVFSKALLEHVSRISKENYTKCLSTFMNETVWNATICQIMNNF